MYTSAKTKVTKAGMQQVVWEGEMENASSVRRCKLCDVDAERRRHPGVGNDADARKLGEPATD